MPARGNLFAGHILAAFLAGGVVYAAALVLFANPLVHWLYGGRYDSAAHWLPLLAPLLFTSGFRLRELIVFMSDKRYGDIQRYLPADLSVF